MKENLKHILKLIPLVLVAGVTIGVATVLLKQIYGEQVPVWIKYTTFFSYIAIFAYLLFTIGRKTILKKVLMYFIAAFITANVAYYIFR